MFHPELGTIVGAKYRLLRLLGAGGMGTVYEAENTITLKRGALKWLHPEYSEQTHGTRRLVHEARATSRIRHDNVVDVYDVVEEESSVFLVMELLQGESLARQLERREQPVHELIALLLAAMRGVAAAHAVGVVHRDIKPDNIFLAHEAGYATLVPKVIDFGISKVFEQDGPVVTRSGITMGTPRYVSYEQLLGAPDVDARTDVYAFGVILYEALTGRPPYDQAKTFAEQAVRFATQVPLSPSALRPELPQALASLIERAIAKEREQRVSSMDELVLALEPFALAASFGPPLLSRTPRSARTPDGTSDPRANALGTQPESHASSAVASSEARGAEPPASAIRRSVSASLRSRAEAPRASTPRGQRFVRVAVGLLLLLLLGALGGRESGQTATRRPLAKVTSPAGLARSSSGVVAAQGTKSPGSQERLSSRPLESSRTADSSPSVTEPASPSAPRPHASRHTSKRPATLDDRAIAEHENAEPMQVTAEVDAGPKQASTRHRAGQLRRVEF